MLNEKQEKPQELQNIEWKELDEVIRKWATQSGFEKDLQKYENLRNEI